MGKLQHALVQAEAGDEVVVQPGDYPTALTVQVGDRVDLHGVAGQPRPRVVYSGTDVALNMAVGAAGTTLRHLEIESPSGIGLHLVGSSAALVREERAPPRPARQVQGDADRHRRRRQRIAAEAVEPPCSASRTPVGVHRCFESPSLPQ